MPAAVMADVCDAVVKSDLEDKARRILLTLAVRADLSGQTVLSERDMARVTGISRSTVGHRLHLLEDLGWLRAGRAPFRATAWTLLIPAGA
jgi:DNA-binding transcriptional MocR family regulator